MSGLWGTDRRQTLFEAQPPTVNTAHSAAIATILGEAKRFMGGKG